MRAWLVLSMLFACGRERAYPPDAGAPPPPPPPPVDTTPRKVTLVPARAFTVGEQLQIGIHSESQAPLDQPISVEVTVTLPDGGTVKQSGAIFEEKRCMVADPVGGQEPTGPFCEHGPIRDGFVMFPATVPGRYSASATGTPAIEVSPITFDVAKPPRDARAD